MTERGFRPHLSSTRRIPWLRWTLAVVVVDLWVLAANATYFAAYLEATGSTYHISPFELIWVQVTTIVLGLLVAAPLIAVAVWLTRRTTLPIRGLPFALGLGALAFQVSARLNTAFVDATGMLVWGAALPFDPIMVILAPVVEESAKAAAVLGFALILRSRYEFGVREGLVAGLVVGLGANAVEAGGYVQLEYAVGHGAIYGTVIALRFGAFGFGLHVATSALLGVAIGAVLMPATRRRGRILVAAFSATLATHVIWNLAMSRLVSEVIVLIAPPPDFSMNEPFSQLHIWIASTMLGLLFLSPILVVLVIAWRRSDPMATGTSHLPVC